MNEAIAAFDNGALTRTTIHSSGGEIRYPRGSMSERNAKLLRSYRRFCGQRLREWLDVPIHVATPGSPTRRVRNPILEDFEEVFRSGTAREKVGLRRLINLEMGRCR